MKEYIYQVIFKNGYIGGSDRVMDTFSTAEEAKATAAKFRKTLSRAEREYYKCSYITKKVAIAK